MEIRKQYSFKGTHVVRNCSSDRCKYSIHGHNYIVEVFLKGNHLDNGQMIYDFGLFKNTFKKIIDIFSEAHVIWDKEAETNKDYFDLSIRYNKKTIALPCSPSAESLSVLFYILFEKCIEQTKFSNGEKEVSLSKVRVHETRTGYAEATKEDKSIIDIDLSRIIFKTDNCTGFRNLYIGFIEGKVFVNPQVELQIK